MTQDHWSHKVWVEEKADELECHLLLMVVLFQKSQLWTLACDWGYSVLAFFSPSWIFRHLPCLPVSKSSLSSCKEAWLLSIRGDTKFKHTLIPLSQVSIVSAVYHSPSCNWKQYRTKCECISLALLSISLLWRIQNSAVNTLEDYCHDLRLGKGDGDSPLPSRLI